MVIFIAGTLLNRRRERLERRRAALSGLVAPPVEHPLLGLGGRSIELSRAQGVPISPDAVVLAADALHELVQRLREAGPPAMADLRGARRSAGFLAGAASEVQLSKDVRRRIAADVASMAGMDGA